MVDSVRCRWLSVCRSIHPKSLTPPPFHHPYTIRLPAQSHYVLHRKQVARKALELLSKGAPATQAEADELSSLLSSLSL